jgi:hypothetical protein
MEPDAMEATTKRWNEIVAAMRAMGIDAESPVHDLVLPESSMPHTVKLDLTAVAPDRVRDAVFLQILAAGWRSGEQAKAASVRRELGM